MSQWNQSPGPAAPLPQLVGPKLAPGSPRAEAKAAGERNDPNMVVKLLCSTEDPWEVAAYLDLALTDVGPTPPPWVAALVASSPTNLLTRTVQGVCLVGQAWAIRGDGWRDSVGSDQLEQFRIVLLQADHVLRGVLAEHPANPIAWRSFMAVNMGLRMPQNDRDAVFVRSHEHCPLDLGIARAYQQSIVHKWGGSFEKSIGFARWFSSQLPDGDPGHALIADAHIENHLMTSDDSRSSEAIVEIRAALERSRLATPEWGNDPRGVYGKNMFAQAAYHQRDVEVAAHMLRAIGVERSRITGSWRYHGDEDQVFLEAGRKVGAW